MPSLQLYHKGIGLRLIIAGACILGFICTYYFTNIYLIENFNYLGEAFYKGEGHLINENWIKAIFFISFRNLFAFTFISALLFLLFTSMKSKIAASFFKISSVVFLLFLFSYLIYEVDNITSSTFDRKDRIVEIVLTWITRYLGFCLGYALVLFLIKKMIIAKNTG